MSFDEPTNCLFSYLPDFSLYLFISDFSIPPSTGKKPLMLSLVS